MAKQEREIERWITVNGARVPIFKGQTVEEAFKEHISKDRSKQAGTKTSGKGKKDSFTRTAEGMSNLQAAKENVEGLKEQLKKHPEHAAEIKKRLKAAQDHYKKLSKGNTSDDNFKTAAEWDKVEKKATAKKSPHHQVQDIADRMKAAKTEDEREKIRDEMDVAWKQIDHDKSLSDSEKNHLESRLRDIYDKADKAKRSTAKQASENREDRQVQREMYNLSDMISPGLGSHFTDEQRTERINKFLNDYSKNPDKYKGHEGTVKSIKEWAAEHNAGGKRFNLSTAKTDGGESKRLGIYKRQLQDVQDDIEQFESTPRSLRSKDYDKKLAELKKKESDLKGWIDNDINARRNESVKEKQLAANKAEAKKADTGSTTKFTKQDIPKGISAADRKEIADLFKKGEGAWAYTEAMERAINKPLDGKKTSTEKSLRRNFESTLRGFEDTEYTVDDGPAKDFMRGMITDYKKRFEDNMNKWKGSSKSTVSKESAGSKSSVKKVQEKSSGSKPKLLTYDQMVEKYGQEAVDKAGIPRPSTGGANKAAAKEAIERYKKTPGYAVQKQYKYMQEAKKAKEKHAALAQAIASAAGINLNGGNQVAKTSGSLVAKSTASLKNMYKTASPEEKKRIASELNSRGIYGGENGWKKKGGGSKS